MLPNDYYKRRYMRYLHAIDTFDIKFPRQNPCIENGCRGSDILELEGHNLAFVDNSWRLRDVPARRERLLISAENAFWRDKDGLFL